MNTDRRTFFYGIAMFVATLGSTATAAIVDPNLLNATTNGVGDDPAGLSTNFSVTSRVAGIDDPEGAFGRNTGPIEPTTFIFGDGRTPDNGDGVLGNGGESVDTLTWNTTSPVVLEGYRLIVGSDGGPINNRGVELVQMSLNGEVDDFFDNNAGAGGDRLFPIAQIANSFRLDVTHTTSAGARIVEIDALIPASLGGPVHVSPTLFNAVTNGVGDEPAGLATNFTSSALYPGDTIEDAFGNNDGGIEPTTVIFSDNGVADNGNNTFDIGLETIDFIAWDTIRPIELFGYQLIAWPDNIPGSVYRGTELVRFYVDGILRDAIDFNAFGMTVDRLFADGPVTGSSFRIEFTRAVGTGGPRIVEINAIVPEPSTWIMALCGAAVLAAFAQRKRRGLK